MFPAHIVSPLEGLSAALPDAVKLSFALGADPRTGKLVRAAAPQWQRPASGLPRRCAVATSCTQTALATEDRRCEELPVWFGGDGPIGRSARWAPAR